MARLIKCVLFAPFFSFMGSFMIREYHPRSVVLLECLELGLNTREKTKGLSSLLGLCVHLFPCVSPKRKYSNSHGFVSFFFLIVAGSFSIGYGLWHTIDACILRTGHWRSRSRFYFVTLICTTGHHFTFYFDTSLYCALCSHVHDADPYAATAASNRGTPMDRPR